MCGQDLCPYNTKLRGNELSVPWLLSEVIEGSHGILEMRRYVGWNMENT